MNKKQEQALFGNVLPKESVFEYEHEIVRNKFRFTGKLNYINANNLIHLARSQREAIVALIEFMEPHCICASFDDCFENEYKCPCKNNCRFLKAAPVILSAVTQDTWKDVRKDWEENQ